MPIQAVVATINAAAAMATFMARLIAGSVGQIRPMRRWRVTWTRARVTSSRSAGAWRGAWLSSHRATAVS
jgi:hypothetical protein